MGQPGIASGGDGGIKAKALKLILQRRFVTSLDSGCWRMPSGRTSWRKLGPPPSSVEKDFVTSPDQYCLISSANVASVPTICATAAMRVR
jgi:hypothetical protein